MNKHFKINIIKEYRVKFALIILLLTSCSFEHPKKLVTIGVPYFWASLDPIERSTAVENSILLNEFEPLIKINKYGVLQPNLAKKWFISKDFKTIDFFINTEAKFSNGTLLSASIIKKSWTEAVNKSKNPQLSPLSALFSKLKGWEKFHKTHELSGLTVLSQEQIRLEFNEKITDAINILSYGRYGIVLRVNEKNYGTGPYKINNHDNEKIVFHKNVFSKIENLFEEIKVVVIPPNEAINELLNNKIDIYPKAEKIKEIDCEKKQKEINCIFGFEENHDVMQLNSLNGIFKNSENRRALLSLIYHEKIKTLPAFYKDQQFFLPFQIGRLADTTIEKQILSKKSSIKIIKNNFKKNTVRYLTSFEQDPYFDFLKSININLTKDSGYRPVEELVKALKSNTGSDLVHLTYGVMPGDPININFFLGHEGNMTSKWSYTETINRLLKAGLTEEDRIKRNIIYKEINKELISQSKLIHLGFSKRVSIFNSIKVKIRNNEPSINSSELVFFEPL